MRRGKTNCVAIKKKTTTDLEELTNHGVAAGNYGIDAAVCVDAIGERGCHDLPDEPAECCA